MTRRTPDFMPQAAWTEIDDFLVNHEIGDKTSRLLALRAIDREFVYFDTWKQKKSTPTNKSKREEIQKLVRAITVLASNIERMNGSVRLGLFDDAIRSLDVEHRAFPNPLPPGFGYRFTAKLLSALKQSSDEHGRYLEDSAQPPSATKGRPPKRKKDQHINELCRAVRTIWIDELCQKESYTWSEIDSSRTSALIRFAHSVICAFSADSEAPSLKSIRDRFSRLS